jgi:hypothetical protein
MRDYLKSHLQSNKGVKEHDLVKRLNAALTRYRAGETCHCGEPIWVIGSAEVGNTCFTCCTGESDPSHDYELEEALRSVPRMRNGPQVRVPHFLPEIVPERERQLLEQLERAKLSDNVPF